MDPRLLIIGGVNAVIATGLLATGRYGNRCGKNTGMVVVGYLAVSFLVTLLGVLLA